MPSQAEARIFISYSRKDAAVFAAELRLTLIKEGLSVWQDIIALEGGRDWWSQIEEAVRSKSLQHFVLIVTPAALESTVVRQEVRLARQEGKTVSPIKGPGLCDLGKLPRWLGQVYDLDLPEHRMTLIRVLYDQSRQKRVAMMAPEPPPDLVARPKEFNKLKKDLLDAKGDAVAISAALKGAGGYGKTTLAKALAHDPDIQDAYFDGVLWVELGESPGNLLSILSDLVEILTGDRPGVETIHAAAAKLGEALGDRRSLLIIDDVWREQDLRPLLQGGARTTRLITTRIDTVLPDRAARHVVDAMEGKEALKLLTVGLSLDRAAAEQTPLTALATRLGEWPLLLKIVNGFLRDRVVKRQQPLAAAIADVNKRLDARGLVAFDAKDHTERSKAVARTIGVGLELMDDSERARFTKLGIFPEDAEIPLDIVHRNWAEAAELDETETEDFVERLHDLSLLLDLDLNRRTLRLHDTIRHFLRDQAGSERLANQHQHLLRSIHDIEGADVDALTRRYFYLYLPLHLAEAGYRARLDALLLDPVWLQSKLVATNAQMIVADFVQYGSGHAHSAVERTLRLIAGICSRDQHQLIPQLLGRLMAVNDAAVKGFLDAARCALQPPAILTQKPSLTAPTVETARLEGHATAISALCALPGNCLASGSWDGAIHLWDLARGAETGRLHGHKKRVSALCVLGAGRLASCSDDATIRLWDLADGVETACLGEFTEAVTALCVLPDGRLASGFQDGAIRLWDPLSLVETSVLDWHTNKVTALCALSDGRLASALWDNSIRLWDSVCGDETDRLTGHKSWVGTVCVLPGGHLASGSNDGTIRLWSSRNGEEIARIEAGPIDTLCALPDGRLASSDSTGRIRIWDSARRLEAARLEGHTGSINSLIALPDGRLVSGSDDTTIRLWDPASTTEIRNTEWHTDAVTALCLLPDGRVVSGSRDTTVRIWSPDGAVEIGTIPDAPWAADITALSVLPDGRFASASSRGRIYLWNTIGGLSAHALKGYSSHSSVLCMLPDGRLASGCLDKRTRLWDLTNGFTYGFFTSAGSVTAMCLLTDGRVVSGFDSGTIQLWQSPHADAEYVPLKGHESDVNALCILQDGRLASGSFDNTIRLWDTGSAVETARIVGHTRSVNALGSLSGGRIVSGADDGTVRVWDSFTCREIARLEFDAPIKCLTLLPDCRLVAGDRAGRLHWLEIVA
jgi:WD40 repeat protein